MTNEPSPRPWSFDWNDDDQLMIRDSTGEAIAQVFAVQAEADAALIVVAVNCTECPAHVRETDDHSGRDMDALEAEAVAAWNRRVGEEAK